MRRRRFRMARPLEVMVSSRNKTGLADGRKLSDLRREVKAGVQQILAGPSGELRITAWINEDSEAIEGSSDWYDESMRRSREAAIALVLFSGDAGSFVTGRGIGICHAELQAALDDAPTKVRAIDVRRIVAGGQTVTGDANARFTSVFESLNLLTRQPATFEDAVMDAVDAVEAAVHELPLGGLITARRG